MEENIKIIEVIPRRGSKRKQRVVKRVVNVNQCVTQGVDDKTLGEAVACDVHDDAEGGVRDYIKWLTMCQGKNRHFVDPIVIKGIKETNKKLDSFTENNIRKWLYKHDYEHLYPLVHTIIVLCGAGHTLLKLSIDERTLVINDFKALVRVFNDTVKVFNTTDVPFLNYKYVTYKLCVRNNIFIHDNFKKDPVFNNMERMIHQEKILKQLYTELGWRFTNWKY